MRVTPQMADHWASAIDDFFGSAAPNLSTLNDVIPSLSGLDLNDPATRTDVQPIIQRVQASAQRLLEANQSAHLAAVQKLAVLNTVFQAYLAQGQRPKVEEMWRQYRDQLDAGHQAKVDAMVNDAKALWRSVEDSTPVDSPVSANSADSHKAPPKEWRLHSPQHEAEIRTPSPPVSGANKALQTEEVLAHRPGKKNSRLLARFWRRPKLVWEALRGMRVPLLFPLAEGMHYYSGTSFEDLVRIVESGGEMSPRISHFSSLPHNAYGYAGTRALRYALTDVRSPGVVLQFDAKAIETKLQQGLSQPWDFTAISGFGYRPTALDRLAPVYFVAAQPVALADMTRESKQTILAWIVLQRATYPEEAAHWEDLLDKFEAALR